MAHKILVVISPERFRDEEFIEPQKVFKDAGADVTVVSTRRGTATGVKGATLKIDQIIEDVAESIFDALVVVGGPGSPEFLWSHKGLHELIRNHYNAGKVVSAICLAGVALANAGVLKGSPATVFKTDESLKAYDAGGAKFIDQPVVRSGNLITAYGPASAKSFGENIVATLLDR